MSVDERVYAAAADEIIRLRDVERSNLSTIAALRAEVDKLKNERTKPLFFTWGGDANPFVLNLANIQSAEWVGDMGLFVYASGGKNYLLPPGDGKRLLDAMQKAMGGGVE